jgi:hypothetical protein
MPSRTLSATPVTPFHVLCSACSPQYHRRKKESAFGNTNTFASKGAMATILRAASADMVLFMCIWVFPFLLFDETFATYMFLLTPQCLPLSFNVRVLLWEWNPPRNPVKFLTVRFLPDAITLDQIRPKECVPSSAYQSKCLFFFTITHRQSLRKNWSS